jgi:WD40 repeat protein
MHAAAVIAAVLAIVPGHDTEVVPGADGTATRMVTEAVGPAEAAEETAAPVAEGASLLYRAQQLWVDRNHQSAIANETSIGGAGQVILASWYLNNDRLSRYVTCGGGTPLWSWQTPENEAQMNVSAGDEGVLSACSPQIGTLAWTGPGSTPDVTEPGSGKQDCNEAAGIMVYARSDGAVVCVDTDTGAQLWESSLLTTGNGIYGVTICGDGSRAVVTVYDSSQGVHVFDTADGSLVGTPFGNYSQTAADISDDGTRIVTGDFYGRVRMWEFDGSDWVQVDSFATGDSWVTAVAISGDGQTAAGGTLAFSPYSGRLVAYDWPSSGDPSEKWQYAEYGDEVSSVDISGDGGVIIAGSWGRYQGTYGDVVTVLDGSGGVIMQLLDDIDEPGSIYSVSVSDDGQWASASGKAVHAREMGNGGQVYALQVSETADNDVAVVDVVSPDENQQVGNTVTPEVTVSNLGGGSASFPVYATVSDGAGPVWSDTSDVTGLAPGATLDVSFADWTVPGYGSWTFEAASALPGDGYPENDSLASGVRAMHDASADAVVRPYDENTVLMGFAPLAELTNAGTYSETIEATLEIDGGGGTVYQETVTTSQLSPGESALCTFPEWTPSETGDYAATLSVEVAEDYVPENDTTERPFGVTWEMIYDDGSWESYYWVGSQDDDMFAVRYTPVVSPPFEITGGRLFVNSTDPFQWASLCPDDGSGLPDVDNPLQVFEDIGAPSAPGWLEIPFDVEVEQEGDLWLVTRWPDAKVLAVGTDMDQPVENRSWWHNRSSGWTAFTSGDYSFRITLSPETGVTGGDGAQTLSVGIPSPNPATTHLAVPVTVPEGGAALEVSVYDLAGRVVARPACGAYPAGEGSLVWDLRTSDGDRAPSGLYVIRVEGGDRVAHRKLLVVR